MFRECCLSSGKDYWKTAIELTVGSECTFGGCYDELLEGQRYKVYWIDPVTCIISELIIFYWHAHLYLIAHFPMQTIMGV